MSSPHNPRFEPDLPSTASEEPLATAQIGQDADALGSAVPPAPTPLPTGPVPIENPVWNGWDVLLTAALTFVAMIVLQFIVLLGAKVLVYPQANIVEVSQKPILLLVSQFLVYIAVAACLKLLVEGKYRVPFWQAIRWNWPSSEWRLLALGAAMLFVLSFLQGLFPMPKDTPFEHLFDRPRDAYLLAIIAVSLGPLMEELFFRGFMYPVLARRIGVVWGILLTALPFGLIHLPQYGWAWGAALVIFLVGVVCGAVRAATKSVAASFLVHVGYNGMQMIIAVVTTHGFRQMERAVASLH